MMPLINVYLREGTTPEHRRDISEAIHKSMVDVLKIPQDDQFHVFHELSADNMRYQPVSFGVDRGDRFMFIQFHFNERDDEQKAALYAAVVDNLQADAGVPKDDIAMMVVETGRANWWVYGRTVNPATGYDERMDDALAADRGPS